MEITINILYKGEKALDFAREMMESGIVTEIRSRPGNLQYEYFVPLEGGDAVLLVDRWKDQEALDLHHQSPLMDRILELRKKYDLHMEVHRYVPEALPDYDASFVQK